MKHYDWQSSVIILLICFGMCLGLHKFTKVVDKYAAKYNGAKHGKIFPESKE